MTSTFLTVLNPPPPAPLSVNAATTNTVLAPVNVSGSVPLNAVEGGALVILNAGVTAASASLDNPNAFGLPYYTASDTDFIYYSWQHVSGVMWLAQRVRFSDLDRRELRGSHPQPVDLNEFQALTFL